MQKTSESGLGLQPRPLLPYTDLNTVIRGEDAVRRTTMTSMSREAALRRAWVNCVVCLGLAGALGACESAVPDTADGLADLTETTKADNGFGVCPAFAGPVKTGVLQTKWADDVSGVVASRRQPGVFWAINDKGSAPLLLAFDRLGHDLGRFELVGALNRDWEDLALEAGAEVDILLVADTGDHSRSRESARIFRIPEPTVDASTTGKSSNVEDYEEIKVFYDDGAAHDAEALFVDPTANQAFVVTRAASGELTTLFAVRWAEGLLETVLDEEKAPELKGQVVAADVSASGNVLGMLFDDGTVKLWVREKGKSISQALRKGACEGPSGKDSARSFALVDDGLSWFVVPENASASVLFVDEAVVCPTFGSANRVGRVKTDMARELSGLVASKSQPGVYWTHNDGADNLLLAVDEAGNQLGTWWLVNSPVEDWEDLAWAPADEEGGPEWLYASDTGNNTLARKRFGLIRFPEPSIDEVVSVTTPIVIDAYEVIEFEYGDGKSHDAEALFVDPLGGDVYVITKGNADDPKTKLFRGRAPLSPDVVATFEKLMTEADAPALKGAAIAADVDRSGEWLAIAFRTDDVRWFRRNSDALWTALQQEPCISAIAPGQVESLAIAPELDGVLMIPEGLEPKVYKVDIWP